MELEITDSSKEKLILNDSNSSSIMEETPEDAVPVQDSVMVVGTVKSKNYY